MVSVTDICAELGFCAHQGVRTAKEITYEVVPLCKTCNKLSPQHFLQETRNFKKQYKTPYGTSALELTELDHEAFQEMVDTFFEMNGDLRNTYWPKSEGFNASYAPAAVARMSWFSDTQHIKDITKRLFMRQVASYQKNRERAPQGTRASSRVSVAKRKPTSTLSKSTISNATSMILRRGSKRVTNRTASYKVSATSSTVPTTKTSGRIVTCNFQPVEFASDQEAVKILHQWSSQHPNNPYPGTRRRGNARLNPPKVIFQDMVVQVTQFTVTKDRASTMRDRVGWLLPCKNGKYLFVKPLAGLYNRGALVAWIGGTNGLGTEVIARLCHSPCTAPPRFPKRIYTASWQSDHTQRMNSLIPINKGLRSLSSRVVRSAREAEAQRSKEDSVDFSTAYEGSSDADHGSTTRTYTPARNDRRVSVMIPARRNVREDSASSFSDMASTAENYPNATDLRSYTRKPITALTTSADQSPQHPTPVSIKRRSSQSFDATQNSSSKRIALDHTNVIFHFIVPLPEGEGPLPDSKPDSIPLDLSECDGSDRFFACAKMAWEMGTSSTGALRGVRCGWDGAKRKSIIPWGNSEIYKSFVGVIRSAKVPEVGERLDVDVDCMV